MDAKIKLLEEEEGRGADFVGLDLPVVFSRLATRWKQRQSAHGKEKEKVMMGDTVFFFFNSIR